MNLDRIVKLAIPLDGYFVLHCLYEERKDLLMNYIINVNKIPTKVFEFLVSEKYLEYGGDGVNYDLNNIQLTERYATDVLGKVPSKNITFDQAFQQLREHYPIKTPEGRRLHQDIDRCKKIYKDIVFKFGRVDEEKHSLILQCINFMVKEASKFNKLEYIKMLPTYLQQKSWDTVIDDVSDMNKNGVYVNKKEGGTNGENKTVLGGDDF